jgi:hypothetical protein
MSEMISTVGTTLASDAPSKMSTVSSFFNKSLYENNKLYIQIAVAILAIFLGYKFIYVPYFKHAHKESGQQPSAPASTPAPTTPATPPQLPSPTNSI